MSPRTKFKKKNLRPTQKMEDDAVHFSFQSHPHTGKLLQ